MLAGLFKTYAQLTSTSTSQRLFNGRHDFRAVVNACNNKTRNLNGWIDR